LLDLYLSAEEWQQWPSKRLCYYHSTKKYWWCCKSFFH